MRKRAFIQESYTHSLRHFGQANEPSSKLANPWEGVLPIFIIVETMLQIPYGGMEYRNNNKSFGFVEGLFVARTYIVETLLETHW